MCSKEEFVNRVAQGLADRRMERELAQIEAAERLGHEHVMYLRNKTDGHGKKMLSNKFFQT